jgi:hypothetical protein
VGRSEKSKKKEKIKYKEKRLRRRKKEKKKSEAKKEKGNCVLLSLKFENESELYMISSYFTRCISVKVNQNFHNGRPEFSRKCESKNSLWTKKFLHNYLLFIISQYLLFICAS